MRPTPSPATQSALDGRVRQQGQARVLALALGFLLLGVVVGAVWYFRMAPRTEATTPGNEDSPHPAGLSQATLAILNGLKAPVEIRLYCSVNQPGAPGELPAFARRVTRLLSEYEHAAGAMIHVSQQDPGTNAAAQAAARADGITPWGLDAGEVCYLGLAVAQGSRTERLPRLNPEWEPALESDISRAIARVTQIPAQAHQTQEQLKATATAQIEVERIIPNLASVSVEEGTQILREAYLQDFIAILKTTQPEIDALEERMRQLQGNISDAQRESLLEELQQLRTGQKEKLAEIASRVETQVAALQQLKGVSKPAAAAATADPSPTRPTR